MEKKEYVRDVKRMSVEYLNKVLLFFVQVFICAETEDRSGFFQMEGSKKIFSFKWSRSYWLKGENPSVCYKIEGLRGSTRTYHAGTIEMTRKLVEEYERLLCEEKGTSPTHRASVPEGEKQDEEAKEKLRERSRNYGSSKEYKSGVPLLFSLAKDMVLCSGPKVKTPYWRRTHWSDPVVALYWDEYKQHCSNCKFRGFCYLQCLEPEDSLYISSVVEKKLGVTREELLEFLKELEIKAKGGNTK